MIKTFESIVNKDIGCVGSKGFRLAQMFNEGLQVPDGFVLTTESYNHYVQRSGIQAQIDAILLTERPLEKTAHDIQALFDSVILDESLVNEIYEAYDNLGFELVAVRSSSTMEDLEGMSFAGQYSSYLNTDREQLLHNIIACWKSLWNERAIEYRRKNDLEGRPEHAVIIQGMVPATSAGVLFTANPVTGIRGEMVVNHAPGFGEGIVSGEVDPDQFSINRANLEVEYSHKIHGGVSASMVNALAKLGEKVEAYYGKPQDIEYAFDGMEKLYLLQTRDITTLFPIDGMVMDDKLRTYLNAGTVMLGMKEPFTPMGFDIMSQMFPTIINVMTARKKNLLTNSFVRHIGGRLFVDMSYLMASKMVSKQFANAFSGNDLPLKGVMYTIIEKYGKQLRRQGIKFRMPLGFIRYGLSMNGRLKPIKKIPNDKRYDAIKAVGEEVYQNQLRQFNALTTDKTRLDFAQAVLIEAFKLSQTQALYCLDVNNFPRIEKALKKHFGDKYKAEVLVQSLEDCITQALTLDLNRYAKSLSEAGRQPDVKDEQFLEIIDKYGVRANMELDIGTLRWHEDPSYLLDLVQNYMEDEQYKYNLNEHEDKRKEAEDLIEAVYEELRILKGEHTASKLKTLMVNYRYGVAMREYPKYDIVRCIELGRQALKSVGENLQRADHIDEVNDVFFLNMKDIHAVLGDDGNVRSDAPVSDEEISDDVITLNDVATRNKERYTLEMKRTTVPRVVMSNGDTYYTSTVVEKGAKTINGLPLSPGVYEGTIRVVLEPKSTAIGKGEIMVTESTNPAWTPLFATAGALIMEYGGPMSHGGIVAREYGIPAVVGIPSATSTLRDGQRVRVNGETGMVELLD